MIHIFVGTKAQFIKMAPIIHELDRRGVPYNFIDAGQHAGITGDLGELFGLRQPDVFLRQERENIVNLLQAICWVVHSVWQVLVKRKQISKRVFQGEKGVCLVHGDTLTTLLSLVYAKRCGLDVAHVEAGLRSYHIFDPFPEEIIRLIAMRYSDILFAPSEWAFENLRKMGYAGKSINSGGNTIIDAIRYARERADGIPFPLEPYVVVTIHRVETIYSRSRMEMLVSLVERIAKDHKVLFVLHAPTRQQLERFELDVQIQENRSIEILPLQPYFSFINLLASADFVVTDGGSVQEESYFFNVPCLVMRSKTERLDGLNGNVYLSQFEESRIEHFLDIWPNFCRENSLDDGLMPSKTIVDYLVGES